MEINARDLEAHPSERPRRAALGEALPVTLRSLPWVKPGNGNKPQGSANPIRIGPDEKSLAEIVGEMRG